MEGKQSCSVVWAPHLNPHTFSQVSEQSQTGLAATMLNFYTKGLLVLLDFSSISFIILFIIPQGYSYPRPSAHVALSVQGDINTPEGD